MAPVSVCGARLSPPQPNSLRRRSPSGRSRRRLGSLRERIEFLKINAVTQRLLVLLREHSDQPGRDLLNTIAHELQHPQPTQPIEAGRNLLDDLCERQILLGNRRR